MHHHHSKVWLEFKCKVHESRATLAIHLKLQQAVVNRESHALLRQICKLCTIQVLKVTPVCHKHLQAVSAVGIVYSEAVMPQINNQLVIAQLCHLNRLACTIVS